MRHRLRALANGLSAALVVMLVVVYAASEATAQADNAQAETPVALVADQVDYDTNSGIVSASGNVEVYYGERTLTADRIIYDSNTGQITAEGRIVVRDPTGATVFADFAELDDELKNGLVRGARSVMGENVRLSAAEARRIDDRFNTLEKAVYSPCKVCAEDPTPLWRIRAKRVIHDEVEGVVHYEDATFDFMGVPIGWLPYFSHPDASVERASGFLVPEIRQSTTYGYGIQVPYYWVIDDYSDFTFSPFFTTSDGVVAVAQYRRAFESGEFSIAGSLTHNNYEGSTGLHGYIETEGDFALVDGYRWGFDAIAVTDNGFLRRYDFSDDDRLTSEFYIRRYQEDGFFDLTAVYFQSLRDDEPSGQIPVAIPDFDFRHDLYNAFGGGDLGLFASSAVLLRGEGLDDSRISLGADWERQEILPSGIVLRGFAQVRGDFYTVDDFSGVNDATEFRIAPLAGIEARYPLIYQSPSGVSHILQPIAQAIVAPYGINDNEIPNEDSRVTEFDETNLFDASHFSGIDVFEEGPRFNLGLRYERLAPGGLNFDASVGRVFRFREADEFTSGSGLSDSVSDWVGAWSLSYDPYITVRQRMRVSNDFSITRNEIGADFSYGRFDLGGSYIFLESDPAIDAPDDRQEAAGRARIRLNRNWAISGQVRRDLELGEFVSAGGGISFVNECCEIDLFVKRDFTSSDDAPASTSVGLRIKLFTLGNEDQSEVNAR